MVKRRFVLRPALPRKSFAAPGTDREYLKRLRDGAAGNRGVIPDRGGAGGRRTDVVL